MVLSCCVRITTACHNRDALDSLVCCVRFFAIARNLHHLLTLSLCLVTCHLLCVPNLLTCAPTFSQFSFLFISTGVDFHVSVSFCFPIVLCLFVHCVHLETQSHLSLMCSLTQLTCVSQLWPSTTTQSSTHTHHWHIGSWGDSDHFYHNLSHPSTGSGGIVHNLFKKCAIVRTPVVDPTISPISSVRDLRNILCRHTVHRRRNLHNGFRNHNCGFSTSCSKCSTNRHIHDLFTWLKLCPKHLFRNCLHLRFEDHHSCVDVAQPTLSRLVTSSLL